MCLNPQRPLASRFSLSQPIRTRVGSSLLLDMSNICMENNRKHNKRCPLAEGGELPDALPSPPLYRQTVNMGEREKGHGGRRTTLSRAKKMKSET